jgi:predicted secreted protein
MLQPKFRAVARVALKGESEMAVLKQRLDDLELENANLRLWQQRRNAVDESISKFTVSELKQHAREHKLSVGGSKSQLLMRLVEAEAIQVK